MTAHDEELIKMGFDAFLSVGDVYRRDEIDRTHFPVFHQLDGVRLYNSDEVLLPLLFYALVRASLYYLVVTDFNMNLSSCFVA